MSKKRKRKHKCRRCGKCCLNVGRTFFTGSEHPLIKVILDNTEEFYDSGKCEMLIWEKGKWVCLIQKYLGKAAKPRACRDYPFDGGKCFYEKKQRT